MSVYPHLLPVRVLRKVDLQEKKRARSVHTDEGRKATASCSPPGVKKSIALTRSGSELGRQKTHADASARTDNSHTLSALTSRKRGTRISRRMSTSPLSYSPTAGEQSNEVWRSQRRGVGGFVETPPLVGKMLVGAYRYK